MKAIKTFWLVVFLTSPSMAQMSNVYQSESFSISRIYAGLYSTTSFPTDSISSQASANFRLGFKSQVAFSEKFMIKNWAAMQFEKNQPVAGFNSLEAQIKPMQKLNISMGLIATPTTVLRPNPTTWESQVETNAQSNIIPGKPGAKLFYAITKNSSITYGYFKQEDQWAHHLNLTIYKWKMAGFRQDDGTYFLAMVYKSNGLENTLTYDSSELISTSAFIHFGSDVSLMLDISYDHFQKDMEFLQTGLRKSIQASPAHLQGFFGITYDWETQEIIGQVFMSLY